MSSQYIYLLQEREFIKTNETIYKIGMTVQENLKRFASYPKGSKLLFQMICSDCKVAERDIIKKFKEQFTLRDDIGSEYFHGDYSAMIGVIYGVIKSDCVVEESDEPDSESDDEEAINAANYKLACDEISKVFPNYKLDESFGGDKKYIIIKKHTYNYTIYYINSNNSHYGCYNKFYEKEHALLFHTGSLEYHYDDENKCESIFCDDRHILSGLDCDELNQEYFCSLLEKKIITIDKVYDINSPAFIKRINKTKINISVINGEEFDYIEPEEIYCITNSRLNRLFGCNMLINNTIYASTPDEYYHHGSFHDKDIDVYGYVNPKNIKKLKDFGTFVVKVGLHGHKHMQIYKIKSKYYYWVHLKKYTPCLIRYNKNHDYYILDTFRKYINLDVDPTDDIDRIKLCPTWHLDAVGGCSDDLKITYREILEKYKKAIQEHKLNRCLNMNAFTDEILVMV